MGELGSLGVCGPVGRAGPAGPTGPAGWARPRVRVAHFLLGRGTTHITTHERGSFCPRQRLRGMPTQAAMQPMSQSGLRTASRMQDPAPRSGSRFNASRCLRRVLRHLTRRAFCRPRQRHHLLGACLARSLLRTSTTSCRKKAPMATPIFDTMNLWRPSFENCCSLVHMALRKEAVDDIPDTPVGAPTEMC